MKGKKYDSLQSINERAPVLKAEEHDTGDGWLCLCCPGNGQRAQSPL